jgi:hypothetical protein
MAKTEEHGNGGAIESSLAYAVTAVAETGWGSCGGKLAANV